MENYEENNKRGTEEYWPIFELPQSFVEQSEENYSLLGYFYIIYTWKKINPFQNISCWARNFIVCIKIRPTRLHKLNDEKEKKERDADNIRI